jgi:hypothetical protein
VSGNNSPSRRSSSPRPDSPAATAAITTRSFSAELHRFCERLFVDFVIAYTFASRSHLDNVGCPTPHSRDKRFARIADGPVIFRTICSLKFSLCCTALAAFSPRVFVR